MIYYINELSLNRLLHESNRVLGVAKDWEEFRIRELKKDIRPT